MNVFDRLLYAAIITAALSFGEPLCAVGVVRPVNSSYMFEVGSAHIADTYLSPLKYTGWTVAFHYERTQAMKFNPENWRQQLRIGVGFCSVANPARNAHMYDGSVSASWSMMHVWNLPHRISLAIGGNGGANVGALYSVRNGNNPVSAKGDVNVGVTGYATWHTRLWRLPVMFRWQTAMPLLGAFFSPEYDQLYYELYLGNYGGSVHFSHPGNFFRWENLVTADLDFSATRLRLGFSSRIYSTEVNHITTRNFTYSFVVGVTGDWFSVSPRKGLPDENARIIYAY